MSLQKLLDDEGVQQIMNDMLERGDRFELISLVSDEKLTSEEVKQKREMLKNLGYS